MQNFATVPRTVFEEIADTGFGTLNYYIDVYVQCILHTAFCARVAQYTVLWFMYCGSWVWVAWTVCAVTDVNLHVDSST